MHFVRCLTVFALVGSMVLVGAVVFAGGAEDSTDDAMAEPMEEPVDYQELVGSCHSHHLGSSP